MAWCGVGLGAGRSKAEKGGKLKEVVEGHPAKEPSVIDAVVVITDGAGTWC